MSEMVTIESIEIVGVPKNGPLPVGVPVTIAVHGVASDGVLSKTAVVTSRLLDENGDEYWAAQTGAVQPSGSYLIAANNGDAVVAGELYTIEITVAIGATSALWNIPIVAGSVPQR